MRVDAVIVEQVELRERLVLFTPENLVLLQFTNEERVQPFAGLRYLGLHVAVHPV